MLMPWDQCGAATSVILLMTYDSVINQPVFLFSPRAPQTWVTLAFLGAPVLTNSGGPELNPAGSVTTALHCGAVTSGRCGALLPPMGVSPFLQLVGSFNI